MSHSKILLMLLILIALGLGGCGETIPLSPMAKCSTGLSSQALTETCNFPTPIRYGEPYERGISVSSVEKGELYKCANKVEVLQAALQKCDKAVDDFNLKLESLKEKK